MFNIGVVFLLSGLWHGASWTFVGWGAGHAIGYLLESKLPKVGFPRWARVLLLFLLVSFLWVLFRAVDYQHAMDIFQSLWSLNLKWHPLMLGAIIAQLIALLLDNLVGNRVDQFLTEKSFIQRWSLYALFLAGIFWFAAVSEEPFIYFQF
jgi:D-alanyl-lipoteichoic acid acyltransferase DltB (MBOAT superfamily)